MADPVFRARTQACMDLAKGYVDTLKLFISAAKKGYTSGATIPSLELELSTLETQARPRGCSARTQLLPVPPTLTA